jgi:hypothetical protein
VHPGQTLAAAKARCTSLQSALLDPACLRQARRDVVAAMLELTPRVAPDGPARFWAEPAPLGDLDEWCEAVRARLAAFGPVAVGVGAWPAVAYALARRVASGSAGALARPAGHTRARLLDADEARAFLDEQPLAVLELEREALETLRALGVRSVGALRRLDPVELGVRFGPEVARARRRAEGDDPRMPWTPQSEEAPQVEVALEHELESVEPLWFLLRPALARLLSAPVGRGEGLTGLTLVLRRERGDDVTVHARSAHPIADAGTLLELVRARLESAPPPTGDDDSRDLLTGFALTAGSLAPLGDRTRDLFGDDRRDPAAREVALARMEGRFGAAALRRATHVETGPHLARATWTRDAPAFGPALPWRGQHPPAPVTDGEVEVAGRRRRITRRGRVERALAPWWRTGALRVERLAWAEVEGPLLVLLRERRDVRPPVWEAVAWID